MAERICSIEGCTKPMKSRGWCNLHYKRWCTTGTTDDPSPQPARTCTIEDCEGKFYARGWCHKHYQRWDLLGTTDDPHPRVWSFKDLTGQRFGRLIAVRRENGRWVCACDCGAETVVLAGALNYGNSTSCGCSRRRQRDGRSGLPNAGYVAVHKRVRYHRGSSKGYACVDCGNPARQWAYDHADPDEKLSSLGPYSLNPDHYQPMCVPCHKRFDLDHINNN